MEPTRKRSSLSHRIRIQFPSARDQSNADLHPRRTRRTARIHSAKLQLLFAQPRPQSKIIGLGARTRRGGARTRHGGHRRWRGPDLLGLAVAPTRPRGHRLQRLSRNRRRQGRKTQCRTPKRNYGFHRRYSSPRSGEHLVGAADYSRAGTTTGGDGVCFVASQSLPRNNTSQSSCATTCPKTGSTRSALATSMATANTISSSSARGVRWIRAFRAPVQTPSKLKRINAMEPMALAQ